MLTANGGKTMKTMNLLTWLMYGECQQNVAAEAASSRLYVDRFFKENTHILDILENDPTMSSRSIAGQVRVAHSKV